MGYSSLTQIAVFLAAAAIIAPLARRFKIGSALGYLLAGVMIGPFGLGLVYSLYEVETILHVAEFGVVLLLFLIGLELRPRRFWAMRQTVFGVGGAQVSLSAVLLVAAAMWLGLELRPALFLGLALALSSTALVLQVLEEKGELRTRHGRVAFSVLLFQDLAAIPLIALVPLFAASEAITNTSMSVFAALKLLAVITLVVLAGRFAVNRLYRLVALTGVKEATTASALLTVVCVTMLMHEAGLSAGLGAFIAGALLADSEYRHQIEADIAPFSGLLMGLFFIGIGMSLNLNMLGNRLDEVLGVLAILLCVKVVVLFAVGRWYGLDSRAARRLAFAVSQGGEFAFVLLTSAAGHHVIEKPLADFVSVVVTASMMLTPLLLLLDDVWRSHTQPDAREFDKLPEDEGHVIIAGFGRFGQVIARILRARRIPFTALDASVEQVDFVAQFGNKIYYGDATHPAVLEAAQTGKARAFVLAIDDAEDSVKTAQIVRKRYPHVPVFARARDRQHVYRLMDAGVTHIYLETFDTSVRVAGDLLEGLGLSHREAQRTVAIFREHDERWLFDDYSHSSNLEEVRARARQQAEELEEIFAKDMEGLRPEEVQERNPATS